MVDEIIYKTRKRCGAMRYRNKRAIVLLVSLALSMVCSNVMNVLPNWQSTMISAATTKDDTAAAKAISEVTDLNTAAISSSESGNAASTNPSESSPTSSSLAASKATTSEATTKSKTALTKAAAVTSEQTGQFGTVTWTLGTDGVLHLSGGSFTYLPTNKSPWNEPEANTYGGVDLAADITSISIDGEITTTTAPNYRYLFAGLSNLTTISGLSNLKMNAVTDTSLMFANDTKLTSIDFGQADFSSVTTMAQMFYKCVALTDVNFNTENVDFSKVTTTSSMFDGCSKLTTVDAGHWQFSAVTIVNRMFASCVALKTVDVSAWQLSKVTNFNSMFISDPALTTLDVSKWQTSSATDLGYMFFNCTALNGLDVSDWDMSNVTNLSNTFANCTSLTKLAVDNWQITSKLTNIAFIFGGASKLQNVAIGQWDTSGVTTMANAFFNCKSFTTLPVENWDVSHVQLMDYAFSGLNLTSLDLSKWKTPSLLSLAYAFNGMTSLTNLNISGLDTRKVVVNDTGSATTNRDYNSAFANDAKLAQLTLGENFSFHPDAADTTYTKMALPAIAKTSTYTGNWVKDADSTAYTSDELMKKYDGSTMAGDYRWEKVGGTVTVRYEDEDGDQVADEDTLSGSEGNSYTTKPKTVDGYTLKTTPTNATGKYTNQPITVTYVYTGELRFTSVPGTVDFGNHALSSGTENYGATPNSALNIQDNRVLSDAPTWTLSAQLTTPFVGEKTGSTLGATLYYQTGSTETPITPLTSTAIMTHTTTSREAVDLSSSWSNESGLVLRVPAGAAELDNYTGQITWNLTNGVANQ